MILVQIIVYLDILPLILPSDDVSINVMTLIHRIRGQCDAKYIMMLLIKTITSVLFIFPLIIKTNIFHIT